jgi:transglutaminase-like putative cysteine protease
MSRKLVVPLIFALAATVAPGAVPSRTVEATYTATITGLKADAGQVNVWIPLPVSRGGQRISSLEVDSPFPYRIERDAEFGNEYVVGTVANPPDHVVVKVTFRAQRDEVSLNYLPETRATRAELERALRADRLVTLSPRIRKLADEVTVGKTDPLEQARAIYQYVMTTMSYDKTRPGWGKGDTERACDVRAGNCTDFHSFFISLARARGIPARFVIGFPLTSKDRKTVGYHCWAEFWVAGRGWIPVDPSEASKSSDPSVRQYLFSNLDPDRLQFTMGRDLALKPNTSEPLNYFIYPHAEVGGREVGVPSIELDWKDIPATGLRVSG